MRIATCLTHIAFFAWATIGSMTNSIAGTDVDLSKYAASSANLSALAAAVSLVEPCNGAIAFNEEIVESYGVVELTVSCTGGSTPQPVILRFDMLDGGKLRPASFAVGG